MVSVFGLVRVTYAFGRSEAKKRTKTLPEHFMAEFSFPIEISIRP